MKRRLGMVLATGALGLTVLAGCGAAGGMTAASGSTSTDTAADSADAMALQQVGVQYAGDTSPAPAASGNASDAQAGGKRGRLGRHPRLRAYLRKHTLHGDVTVQTKNGPRTIAVQRGTVESVSSDSIRVKSSDGFVLTWHLGKNTKVRQNKQAAELSALKANEEIGVAGGQQGNVDNARLIVIVTQ
jgi:hypothetical protein